MITEFRRPAEPITIPDDLIDTNDIGHMEIGESGWTVPWAVSLDNDLKVWISEVFPIEAKPQGTVSLFIKRVEGGILVKRETLPKQRRPIGQVVYTGPHLPVIGWL